MQKCALRRHDAAHVVQDGIRTSASVLAAGLRRIFIRMVWRTAPFKSQNMALNSGITPMVKRWGRAQIFRRKPRGSRQMCAANPVVLLKPTSDRRAQVADGAATNMDAVKLPRDYKPRLRASKILAVYNSPAQEYDVIVLKAPEARRKSICAIAISSLAGNGGNGPVSGYSGGG